jgi:ribosomal protein S18 acetylase RimI-like enzyme
MLLEVSTENTAALGFYERARFVGISRRRGYYRDGSDALVLARDLL